MAIKMRKEKFLEEKASLVDKMSVMLTERFRHEGHLILSFDGNFNIVDEDGQLISSADTLPETIREAWDTIGG